MAASVEPLTNWIPAASVAELESKGRLTANVGDHVVLMLYSGGKVFAVDNRCPHMGFPLDRGTVKDCILTCHWHHARFDLNTGGTFDQWADDVRAFPTKIEAGQVLIDVNAPRDRRSRHLNRLRDGLEREHFACDREIDPGARRGRTTIVSKHFASRWSSVRAIAPRDGAAALRR